MVRKPDAAPLFAVHTAEHYRSLPIRERLIALAQMVDDYERNPTGGYLTVTAIREGLEAAVEALK
jgi:hypothetical protein